MKLAEQAQFQATKRKLRKQLTVLRSEFNRLKNETDHLKTKHRDLSRNLTLLSRSHKSSALQGLQSTLQKASLNLDNMTKEVSDLRKYENVLKHVRDRLAKESHSYPKTLRSYEAVLNARTAEIVELKDAVANATHARDTARMVLESTKKDCAHSLEILTKERDGRVKMLEEEEKVLAFFENDNNDDDDDDDKDRKENDVEEDESELRLKQIVSHPNAHEEAMRQIFALTGLTNEDDIIRTHQERKECVAKIEQNIEVLKKEIEDLKGKENSSSSPTKEEKDNDTYETVLKKYRKVLDEHIKSNEMKIKLKCTIESLMRIVAPLGNNKDEEEMIDEFDGDDDENKNMMKRLTIIANRLKFGLDELAKRRRDSGKNKGSTESS